MNRPSLTEAGPIRPGRGSRGPWSLSGTVIQLIGDQAVVVDGSRVPVPDGGRRLLAFLALHDGPVDRRYVAGTLWPECDECRAAGNLRTALWRLRAAGIDLLRVDRTSLGLREGVATDVREVSAWADRLITGAPQPGDLRPWWTGRVSLDILPGWYDDWVVFEREWLRQQVLHACESLSRTLTTQRRYAEAIAAATEAVALEPLRESAHRVLIEAHVAEGNVAEARRAYGRFAALIGSELGVYPGADLRSLAFRTAALG